MNQFFASHDVTAMLWAFAVLKELPGMELMDALRRRALIVMLQVKEKGGRRDDVRGAHAAMAIVDGCQEWKLFKLANVPPRYASGCSVML